MSDTKQSSEANEDDFCEQLYQSYLIDTDNDEAYTLDECKQEWAID